MSQHSTLSAITTLNWTAQTSPGRYRSKNEDAFLLMMFDRFELCYLGKEGETPLDDRHFIFAVSDGIGGHEAGEFASQSALKSISDLISRHFHRKDAPKELDHMRLLTAFCEQIHDAILQISKYYSECHDMGATLSIGWVHQQRLHFAHLGDSRIYHIPQGGSIQQLTEDHTVAARKVREGKMTAEEAKRHTSNHVLEKSIGSGKGFDQPQLGAVDLQAGDKLIFCTDGVADGVSTYTIEKAVLNPPAYLQGLNSAEGVVKEAFDASGRDNITAIVVDLS